MKKPLMIIGAAVLLPLAQADEIVWDGGANDGGNLLTYENWSGDVAPTESDTAAIGDEPEANLSNGSATYAHLKLGTENGKTGKLTVGNGGTLTVTATTDGALSMGNADGSAGELTINGGDVTIESLNTPNKAATSTINLIDGTLTIKDWADWGKNSKGKAVFNQSGGTLDLKKGFQIGPGDNGTGTYNMSGGVINGCVADHFRVGWKTEGIFNLTGGTMNLGPNSSKKFLYVGHIGGSNGTFTQDGGIVIENDLRVGDYSGATGLYTLNAGTNRTSSGWIQIGRAGTGKFVQNGGEVQLQNAMKIRLADASSGDGAYIINGGLLTIDGTGIDIGQNGKGLFVMNGGTVAAKQLSSAPGATGEARVFLNGGRFKSSAAGSIFAKGSGTADWTLGRDFTVDTDGKDVSSAVALAAASGSALTKDGEGKLTLAALPLADSVTVKKGTLALSAGGDNTKSVALAHRWSFNGNANDSVGGATGALVGSAVYTNDNTAVYLPGGNNGTSYVNLGKGLIAGDNLTLEFWAKRVAVTKWGRVFECGTSQTNYITVSWVRGARGDRSKVAVQYGTTEKNQTDKMDFTDNEMIHLAIRFVKNEDGSTTITWVRRSVDGTGEVKKTSDFTPTGLDAGWTLDKVALGDFFLGHTAVWTSDNDANAVYDEVRVWHGALSDEALTLSAQKGPDATAEDIAAIIAKNDESMFVDRTVAVASGATLDLGGNTLTQPVVKGDGTITTGAGGKLIVSDKLLVKAGECIKASGTIDLSSAKLEIADPENLSESFTFLKPVDGQTLTVVGEPTVTNLPKSWKVSVSGDGTGRIFRIGLIISFH